MNVCQGVGIERVSKKHKFHKWPSRFSILGIFYLNHLYALVINEFSGRKSKEYYMRGMIGLCWFVP